MASTATTDIFRLVKKNLNFLTGVVTHAHRCESTVRVRVMKQVWNKKLRKVRPDLSSTPALQHRRLPHTVTQFAAAQQP